MCKFRWKLDNKILSKNCCCRNSGRNSDIISKNFEILLEIRHYRNFDFEILAAEFPVYRSSMSPLIYNLHFLTETGVFPFWIVRIFAYRQYDDRRNSSFPLEWVGNHINVYIRRVRAQVF